MAIYIVKHKGNKQKFNKVKVARSCVKAGAERAVGARVANEVSVKVVDGLSTRKVGELTIAALRRRDRNAALAFQKYFNMHWR